MRLMTSPVEEAIAFPCEGHVLLGVLHRPPESSRSVSVLIVVGGPQYRVGSHRQFVASARSLALDGAPVLRFDYRGMGDSEGDYSGFEGIGVDIRSAVDVLCSSAKSPEGVVLFGLCDAASACLIYGASDPRVAGLVLINPWVRSDQTRAAVVIKRYYGARLLQVDFWRKLLRLQFDFLGSLRSLLATLRGALAGRQAGKGPGFIGQMRDALVAFGKPVLVVQSGRDLTCDEFKALWQADPVWRGAMLRKSVQIADLPHADHTFSQKSSIDEFNAICNEWLERQFPKDLGSQPGA